MGDRAVSWTATQISLRRGQTRQEHRRLRIVAAWVFEDLGAVSHASCSRDVELLSSVRPLVLAESARPGESVLVAGVGTWHAAIAATGTPRANSPRFAPGA